MQKPVSHAITTICKIFCSINAAKKFCGKIDKNKLKICLNSSEFLVKNSPSKLKFITGKNIPLIKIEIAEIKNITAKNLFKIFVPRLFSIATSSMLQMLATIEIKIIGMFDAIKTPSKTFKIGVIISFVIKFCAVGEKNSLIKIAQKIANKIEIVFEPPGIFKFLISLLVVAVSSLKPFL